jgi:PDZ domain-containing protein
MMSINENEPESDHAQKNSQENETSEKSHAKRAIAIIVAVLLFLFAAYIPYWLSRRVPYYSLGPGPTESVDGIIQVPAARNHPHKGQLYFTTVNESSGRLRRAQYYITKWFSKDTELEPAKNVEIPNVYCTSPDRFATETMSDSQKTALSVALRRLGQPVSTSADQFVQVLQLAPHSAAVGKIRLCDTITSIDNTQVHSIDQLREYVQSKKPGDQVTVALRDRLNNERTVSIKLGSDKDGKALLGVLAPPINPDLKVSTPLGVAFRQTQVGGPSAGTAFTLGIIDDLTPGELTGGKPVAVTGEITLDGKVQEIGGIAEKTHSVYNHGIRLFLVPAKNYKEAKAAAPKGLTVVSISNIDEALAALAKYGGNTTSIPKPVDLSKL